MQSKRIIFGLTIGLFFIPFISAAQDPVIIEDYINTYKHIAITEMQRSGVPAAIKLAQGIHETMAGTSVLVLKSNNHFGIKCKSSWLGASVTHDDDLRGECFRKYVSAVDSYRDHSDFLKSGTRYSFLFKLEPTDYKDWAYGLKKAGYATNPKYPQIIINLIEKYSLQNYTLIAMGKVPVTEDAIAKEDDTQALQKTTDTNVIAAVKIEEISKIEKDPKTEGTAQTLQSVKLIEQPHYPEGEFKINETKVVYAKQGTSFLNIAQQYNIPLARIFEFNDIEKNEVVNKDQLIFLQRKRKTGNNEFHIVQQNETLHDIAQTEAIRLETLKEYNLLTGTMKPAVGEKLYLRTKAKAAPRLALRENYSLYPGVANSTAMNSSDGKSKFSDKSLANIITYTVKPKETIHSVSQKYNVSIEDIVKWNQLSSNKVKKGQQLKIYK